MLHGIGMFNMEVIKSLPLGLHPQSRGLYNLHIYYLMQFMVVVILQPVSTMLMQFTIVARQCMTSIVIY